ncbi:amino acid ABC transporter periplasmic protein [Oleiphilus messinensis]|uniref:Amino acid ABC transporter periplasmic protein n=1 Tax=Oleiphilus messinensis TaxID=141451 RepID=A0A1Y0IHS2_9GAMM|nr:transporter substrate-binding domain-containing protein [Oleiphilus messinensis]ARU58934.1 amino acid ABC transporter periplasmic protein [Oleiphilus messinensis]
MALDFLTKEQRRFTLRCCLVLVLTFQALFFSGYSGATETVRIASGEWPPYLSQDLIGYGVSSQLVTAAFKAAGLGVEYAFFPWNRSFASALKGQFDATIGWERTPDRERDFWFSARPILVEQTVLFYLQDNPALKQGIWQADRSRKLLVGTTLGYEYGQKLFDGESQGYFVIYPSPTDELNLKLLVNRRIDLFPIDRLVGIDMMKKHFSNALHNVRYDPEPLRVVELYLLISKNTTRGEWLKARFDEGMNILDQKGVLNEYFEEAHIVPR